MAVHMDACPYMPLASKVLPENPTPAPCEITEGAVLILGHYTNSVLCPNFLKTYSSLPKGLTAQLLAQGALNQHLPKMPDDSVFEDCTTGTFYGFTNDKNNEFHPGDTFTIQWGAYDDYTPLNITLARLGGSLVSDIVEFGIFSDSSSLYRSYSPSPNCTLEQYNWTIPANFDTTNPTFNLALMNATQARGTDGNALSGFLAWSPIFYVRDKASATSSTGTVSTSVIPTSSVSHTLSPTAITGSSDSSDDLSTGAKAGIGVGVSIAGLLVLGLLAFVLRRRFIRQQPASSQAATVIPIEEEPLGKPELSAYLVHEMDAGAPHARLPELDSER